MALSGKNWEFSGIVGGGGTHQVRSDPTNPQRMIFGGDNSGFWTTENAGGLWRCINRDIESDSNTQKFVRCIKFDETNPGRVWLGTGLAIAGNGAGAMFRSDDYGVNKTRVAAGDNRVSFGGGARPGGGSDWPRIHGNMILLDNANDRIYIASKGSGLMRSDMSSITNSSFVTLAATGGIEFRAIQFDPTDSTKNTIVAVSQENGCYRITNVRGSATKTQTSAGAFEQIQSVGTTLYATRNTNGVFKSVNGGASWTELGASFFGGFGGTAWSALRAYRNPTTGAHVIYVGASGTANNATSKGVIAKSTDGGNTWTRKTPGTYPHASVSPNIYGSGARWWIAGLTNFFMGDIYWDCGDIEVIPAATPADDIVLCTGRSGLYRSSNGGDTWNPCVRGVGGTMQLDLALNPNDTKVALAGVVDWKRFWSNNYFDDQETPKQAGGQYGPSVAIDHQTGDFYTGEGANNGGGGGVATNTSPFSSTGGTWTSIGAPSGTTSDVSAIAVGRNSTGDRVIIATQGGSTYRKVGSGSWSQTLAWPATSITWPKNDTSRVVYAASGTNFSKSTDAGATWTSNPSGGNGTGGYVTARYDAPGTWIRNSRPVAYKINGGSTAIRYRLVGTDAIVERTTDDGATWVEMTDPVILDTITEPSTIGIAADDTWYLGFIGGLLVSRTAGVQPPPQTMGQKMGL